MKKISFILTSFSNTTVADIDDKLGGKDLGMVNLNFCDDDLIKFLKGFQVGSSLVVIPPRKDKFPTEIFRNKEILDSHPHFYVIIWAEYPDVRKIIGTPDIVINDTPEIFMENKEETLNSLRELTKLKRSINYYYDLSEEERKGYDNGLKKLGIRIALH